MARGAFFSKLYKFHIYAGLFLSAHFAIFAVTGLALLFQEELTTVATKPETFSSAQAITAYTQIYTSLKTQYPNDRVLAIYPEEANANIVHARLGKNGETKLRGSLRKNFDTVTSQEISDVSAPANDFFAFLLTLHRELFLGTFGKVYVGILGALYVFLLISGLIVYGRFMKGRSLGDLRTTPIARRIDWHKLLGVTTFGWSLLVGLTGTLLAFNSYFIKWFQWRSLKHLALQFAESGESKTIALEQGLSNLLAARPNAFISYISFPNTEYGIPGHLLVLVKGTSRITEHLTELFVINAASGAMVENVPLPFYLKALLLSEPLHFGDYGGIGLKFLWGLFAVGSLAVMVLGVWSFWAKRKKSKVVENYNYVRRTVSVWQRHPLLASSIIAIGIWFGLVGLLFWKGVPRV